MQIEFGQPQYLYYLLVIPLWWLIVWPRSGRGLPHVGGESLRLLLGRWRTPSFVVLGLPRLIRSIAAAAFIVALADPRELVTYQETELRGKRIVLAVDVSSSMLALDMGDQRSRMSVAREATVGFAEGRALDELSLVAFAGEAVTLVPPTEDPAVIVTGAESLEPQLVLDGTNISAAMLTSTRGLLDADSASRVIVLLTDGAHNGLGISPLATARAAAALGVRVHSIALVGQGPAGAGVADALRQQQMESEMETVLTGISRLTEGRYFRASSPSALDSIFRSIHDLETPVEVTVETIVPESRRIYPLLLGLVMLCLEVAFLGSRWSVIP